MPNKLKALDLVTNTTKKEDGFGLCMCLQSQSHSEILGIKILHELEVRAQPLAYDRNINILVSSAGKT